MCAQELLRGKRPSIYLITSLILILAGSIVLSIPFVYPAAVVEFYSIYNPKIVSYNFAGSYDNPTLVAPGSFKPWVQVSFDEETRFEGDPSVSYALINDQKYALYIDLDTKKIHSGSFTVSPGKKYHIVFHMTFKRFTTGETYTLDVEGYVMGVEIKTKWYMVGLKTGKKYDLSSLGPYEVLAIPMQKVEFQMVATEGANFISKVTMKIWDSSKHEGVPIEWMEKYTPEWTLTLTKRTVNTWSVQWEPPHTGSYVIFGYVTVGGKVYKQLSLLLPFGQEVKPTPTTEPIFMIIGAGMIIAGVVILAIGWARKELFV